MKKFFLPGIASILLIVFVTAHIFSVIFAASAFTSTPANSAGNTAAVTSSAGDNNGLESNPTNALLNGSDLWDDNVFAQSVNSGTNTSTSCALPNTVSDQHNFLNFNLYGETAVSDNATIAGVTVTVGAKYDSASGTNTVCVFLSWNGGTSWTTGKNSADIGTGDTTITLGGAADLWGRTWAPGEFSNTNFRMRVMSLVGNVARDLSVDYVRVAVTHDDKPNYPSQDSPAASATGLSLTPTFTMTATDDDGSKIGYKVTIYSNSGCTSVVQTHDQAVTSTGWTGTNTSCTAAPNSCYTSGTQGNFTVQAGDILTASTQYWWKSFAKDPDNIGVFASSTACRDFTTGTGNSLPVASSVSIDSGASAVTLTEGTTQNVACVGTVTDTDGYTNISSVTADLFRTSVGIGSGLDDNDHYRLSGDANVVPSGGSGNSETYTATFPVQYFADATDAGSPNSSDTWTCTLTPSDSEGAGTASSDTVEMNSLLALDVTSSISYGSLSPNTDTGATNQTVTVTNTGNRDMDPQISGTTMTSGGNSIAIAQQKYFGSTFTYSSGGTALSGTPTTINLTLPQRTSTAVTANTYWGIGVPNGTASGSYSGTNTYTATSGI